MALHNIMVISCNTGPDDTITVSGITCDEKPWTLRCNVSPRDRRRKLTVNGKQRRYLIWRRGTLYPDTQSSHFRSLRYYCWPAPRFRWPPTRCPRACNLPWNKTRGCVYYFLQSLTRHRFLYWVSRERGREVKLQALKMSCFRLK